MSCNVTKAIGSIILMQLIAFYNLHAASYVQGLSFALAPSLSQFTYQEPGYMEDKGVMYGLTASYTWRGEKLGPVEMIKAEIAASWSSVDYTSINSGSINGIPDSMIETRALMGTNLFPESRTVITPYAGLGYRRLTDKSEGMISTSGAFGYDRQANYYYSPVGIEISSDFEKGWSLGGLLEYDFFINGTQITSIPQDMRNNGSTVSSNFTNAQHGGYGLRASLKIKKKIDNAYAIVFEPYYRYWNIKVSNPDSVVITDSQLNQKTITVVEPANNSSESGIKVELNF